MNQEPQVTREYKKDGSTPDTTVQITQAIVRVGHTEIKIWHILQQEVFAHLIIEFNRKHPNNNTPSNAKQKIMKFVNQKFGVRVAYKSKEAFLKHLAVQTRRMAMRVK
jgi:hypothetical protein